MLVSQKVIKWTIRSKYYYEKLKTIHVVGTLKKG